MKYSLKIYFYFPFKWLHQIEKLTITVNGGKETLNFAEAALIIRGSASVYCKKVDYLHGLTVGMLDTLGANKRLVVSIIL